MRHLRRSCICHEWYINIRGVLIYSIARKLFETQNKSDARKGIITDAERSEMTL